VIIQYEKELNPAQLQAVTHTSGPVLVIAGAGSGKTRTLVYRVAWLVEQGVEPGAILLLTFTRRAAEEMLSRAARLLDEHSLGVEGGTFHSFANRMLRLYGDRIHLPTPFTILDRGDTEGIISWIRKDKGLNKKELRFPRKGTLASIFSRSVNTGASPEELISQRYDHLDLFTQDIVDVWKEYTRHKRQNALLDYDDLLVFFSALLQEDEWARQIITQRYSYILVDEFQDTNHLQADIVEMLGGGNQNIMAVGDDSQSIYSFRGARFQNMVEFPRRFPETTIIKLEQNYRSTQPVLDIANKVIAESPTPYTKCLFTEISGGPEPTITAAQNEHHQSLLVVQSIANLLDRGVRPSEIAVLFRSSFHSFDLEVELGNRGYSFVKYGGFKFLELAHIKDVMAHLRVLANRQDAYSWRRILMLVPGVGMSRAENIMKSAVEGATLVEGLRACPQLDKLPKLKELTDLFAQMEMVRGNPSKRVELVLDYYQPLLEAAYDDHPKRRRQLEELAALAQRFTKTDDFLAEVTLEPPQDERRYDMDKDEALTLSTIHSSKGLEWRAVYIIWAAEGWFPSGLSVDDSEDLEEERRLLYVAVTRAREWLYILYPRMAYKRGEGEVWTKPSRYIENLTQNGQQACAPLSRKGTSDLLLNLNIKYGGSLTGKRVNHPTFGAGSVMGHKGTDNVVVKFDSKGLISLNLKYAPLTIIEE